MTLETAISISRVTTNHGPDYVQIAVEDRASHSTFVEVRMTLEEFGSALSGMSYTHCTTEVAGLSVLGKTHQHKTEAIPGLGHATWAQRFDLVKPFEVDGWQADSYDMKNVNHHRVRGNDYLMTFRRYVDASQAEGTEALAR